MTSIKLDLMDSLPRYYDDSPEVIAIMEGNALEIDKARKRAREITNQYYVRTANEIGLAAWERVLDLPPRPNSSFNFRRNRIIARLNGTAPATVAYLTDVVNAHVGDKSARIIEHNGEYRFEAQIPVENSIDTVAIRRDMEEVKPAHLAFSITGVNYGGVIEVGSSHYDFDVPYRPANTFNTDDMDGRKSEVPFVFIPGGYNFDVPLPITNELKTDNVHGFDGSSGLSVNYSVMQMDVKYPICGVLYTTEGVV